MKWLRYIKLSGVGFLMLLLVGCQNSPSFTFTTDPVAVLHTEAQSGFLADTHLNIFQYAAGREELSRPNPAVLEWQAKGVPAGTPFLVLVSEQEDMSAAREYRTTESALELYNLKIGTTYYYTISVDYNGAVVTSAVQQFTTAPEAPRNMFVDGVTNVRDLGGWKTADGGSIRQGLIYRCGALSQENDDGEVVPLITETGIETMRSDMGIRTEIDFRVGNGGITESALGTDVRYLWCPIDGSQNYLLHDAEQIRHIFEILSDRRKWKSSCMM